MLKNDKIVGYALLVLGLVLLVFSIIQMITVYYGYSPAPKLFELQDISVPVAQTGTDISLVQGTQVSQLADLICWFLLMGFVLFGGGKIASIGVSLIKDIQVQVKDATGAPQEKTIS